MTENKSRIFKFADVEVREWEFLFVEAGKTTPVEPKAFRVLLFLLQNPERLVTKDELIEAVWKDCSVSDNSLTKSIATLRRLLKDDVREPRYIATVQTVGYRFICKVTVTEDPGTGMNPPEILRSANDSAAPPPPQMRGTPMQRVWRRFAIPGTFALAFLILAVALFVGRSHLGHSHGLFPANPTDPSAHIQFLPILSVPGRVTDPAISPDGKEMAFVWDGQNPVRGDVYIHLIGGEKPLRLTHTESGFNCCVTWSPDGRQVAFGRCDDSGGSVFTVSALGGPERKVTTVACTQEMGTAGWPVWTRDGTALVIADQCAPKGAISIVLFSLATGEKHCLTHPENGDLGDSSPVLSPDGSTIAFIRRHAITEDEICTVPLQGGRTRVIASEGESIWGLMWSSDGRRLVFRSPRRGIIRVWKVSLEGGPVTAENVYPEVGSQSRDGTRFVYIQSPGHLPTETVRVTLSRPGGPILKMQTLLASASLNAAPQISTDGTEIVYESSLAQDTGCTMDIWKSNADGSNPLQMTSFHGHAGTPRWSPDGRWIAFDYRPGLRSRIYVMDSQGRNSHEVTSGPYQQQVPSWSRDGKSIYFTSNSTGDWQIWRRELESGVERQITHGGGFAAFESHDGKTIYYSKFEGGGIWTVPTNGGTEERIIDALHVGYWGHFAVIDSGIYILDSDAKQGPTILFYDFKSRRATPVLTLPENPLPWTASLAASPDGLTLFFVQYKLTSSITLMENL